MNQQVGVMVFTAAGTAIGAYFGGSYGAIIGGLAGGLIGSLVFARSNSGQKPIINDINLMSATYGNPIPLIWGEALLPATMLWMSDVKTQTHNASGGGKGGGSSTPASVSYWQNAQMAFSAAPAKLVKLFLDGKLFLDNLNGRGELTNYRFAIRECSGSEDQQPDFLYTLWVEGSAQDTAHVQGRKTPAFRGLHSLVFDKIDLANFGNRFPQVTAIVSNTAAPTTLFNDYRHPVVALSGSLSHDTSYAGGGIDHVRGLFYTLSGDGTLRCFDLATHTLLRQVTDPRFMGLIVGNGSNLYCYGKDYYYGAEPPPADGIPFTSPPSVTDGFLDTMSFFQVDAYSLKVNFAQDTGRDLHNLPSNAIVITLPYADSSSGKSGYFDIVTGGYIIGGQIFVYKPPISESSALISFGAGPATVFWNVTGFHDTFTSVVQTCRGQADALTGKVAVWYTNYDGLGTTLDLLEFTFDPGWATLDQPNATFAFIPSHVRAFTPADFPHADGTPPTGFAHGAPVWDNSDGTLIITGQQWDSAHSFKYQPFTGHEDTAILWTSPYGGGASLGSTVLQAGLFAGGFWGSDGINVLDTATGAVEKSPVPDGNPTFNSLFAGILYDPASHAMVYYGADQDWHVAYLQRVTSDQYMVADIITDLCQRVGLTSADLDVSLVTQLVRGYCLRAPRSAGAALADLCHVYQIDMVETDYHLKFIPRGQAPVVTIPQDDLLSMDANDPSRFWIGARAQETELPLAITIKYLDHNLDLQPGSMTAKRTSLPVATVFSKRRMQTEIPIVATSAEARAVAETWLYTMWAERDTYQTMLSPKYLWLDAGDNVVVTLDNGDVYDTRISQMQIGADLTMRLNMSAEDATTYGPSSMPGAAVGFQQQTVTSGAFAELLLLDAPLLQDTDDTGGVNSRIYVAAGASPKGWLGATLMKSTDAQDWAPLVSVTTLATFGSTVSVLGDHPPAFSTDYTNTLGITLSGDSTTLASCSYLDAMNGANALLVGLEVIQFLTAAWQGDGLWILSGLLRGRRGTEWATNTHVVGEDVVVLQPGGVVPSRLPLTQINSPLQFRLVSTGRFLDQAPNVSGVFHGRDLLPYAPVYFRRTDAGGNVTIDFSRRTRIGGLLLNGTDAVPLNESSEAYEVYALKPASPATFNPLDPTTYLRKWTPGASTVTWTAAEMTADGFVAATMNADIIAYQLSSVVGRGYPGYAILTPP